MKDRIQEMHELSEQARQANEEYRTPVTDCPIKLPKIHCENCYFNPSGKSCDYKGGENEKIYSRRI